MHMLGWQSGIGSRETCVAQHVDQQRALFPWVTLTLEQSGKSSSVYLSRINRKFRGFFLSIRRKPLREFDFIVNKCRHGKRITVKIFNKLIENRMRKELWTLLSICRKFALKARDLLLT